GLLSGGRVPDLHRLVLARRGEAFAVGAEAHAEHAAGVSLEGADLLAGVRVPHRHLSSLTQLPSSRGKPFAVGAEAHVDEPRGMPLEGELLPSAGHVPHLYCLAPAGGRKAFAAGAEDYAGHRLEGELLLARPRVPHFRRSVLTPRGDAFAVG